MRYTTLLLLLIAGPAFSQSVQTPAVGGFRCQVTVDGAVTKKADGTEETFSTQHTAQSAGINAGFANPGKDVRFNCVNEWRVLVTPAQAPEPTPEPVALPTPASVPQFKPVVGGIEVSWTPSIDAHSEGFQCGNVIDNTPCAIVPNTKTGSSVVVNFKSDGWFCVVSWNIDLKSVQSCNAFTLEPPGAPPPEPEPTTVPDPVLESSIKLVADPGGVKISWDAAARATKYWLTWNTDGSGLPGTNVFTTETTVVVPMMSAGYACITAQNEVGNATAFSCGSYVPAVAEGAAQLTWDAVGVATGYRLFTGTVPGFGGGAGIDVGNVTAYTATGFTAGTTHYFRVSAYNNTDESKHSNEVSKTF